MEVTINPEVSILLQNYLYRLEKMTGLRVSPSNFASTAIREKMERRIISLRSAGLAHELHY